MKLFSNLEFSIDLAALEYTLTSHHYKSSLRASAEVYDR